MLYWTVAKSGFIWHQRRNNFCLEFFSQLERFPTSFVAAFVTGKINLYDTAKIMRSWWFENSSIDWLQNIGRCNTHTRPRGYWNFIKIPSWFHRRFMEYQDRRLKRTRDLWDNLKQWTFHPMSPWQWHCLVLDSQKALGVLFESQSSNISECSSFYSFITCHGISVHSVLLGWWANVELLKQAKENMVFGRDVSKISIPSGPVRMSREGFGSCIRLLWRMSLTAAFS